MPDQTPTPTPAPTEPLARTLLAVPEGYGAPHHDAARIKAEDYVLQVDESGFIRAGRAHRQNEGGWLTEDDRWITYAAIRADRPDAVTVWPAPTPPAVEVEMPTEHPAHLTDVVETEGGDHIAYAALNVEELWCGVDQDGYLHTLTPELIAAFTLPDGTRARRDGDHANGEPRFVKTQEEEK